MSLTLNCVTSIQRNRKSEDQFLQLSRASDEYMFAWYVSVMCSGLVERHWNSGMFKFSLIVCLNSTVTHARLRD